MCVLSFWKICHSRVHIPTLPGRYPPVLCWTVQCWYLLLTHLCTLGGGRGYLFLPGFSALYDAIHGWMTGWMDGWKASWTTTTTSFTICNFVGWGGQAKYSKMWKISLTCQKEPTPPHFLHKCCSHSCNLSTPLEIPEPCEYWWLPTDPSSEQRRRRKKKEEEEEEEEGTFSWQTNGHNKLCIKPILYDRV